MNETAKTDDLEQSQDKIFFRGGFWWIALGAMILASVVVWLSRFFDTVPAQYTFIGQNVLNVLIAAAIVVQALIYRRQWDSMRASLAEARILGQQNALAVQAAQDSAKTARDAFYVGEAPYFGVKGGAIFFTDLMVGRAPGINATFMNGGRTPAWHFHQTGKLVIGDSPDSPDHLPLVLRDSQAATFVPSGAVQGARWRTEFIYRQDLFDMVSAGQVKLFAVVEVHYMDMRKVWHHRSFQFVWDPVPGTFGDYGATEDKCHYCKRARDSK